MPSACPRCNEEVEANDKFCGYCSYDLVKHQGIFSTSLNETPPPDNRKVFSMEDDPTQAEDVPLAAKVEEKLQAKKAARPRRSFKAMLRSLKLFFQSSLWFLVAMIPLLPLPLWAFWNDYLQNPQNHLMFFGLALLPALPFLLLVMLRKKGYEASMLFYPVLHGLCASLLLQQVVLPDTDKFSWLGILLFAQLLLQCLFTLRLLWFVRLTLMLLLLPLVLDLYWQLALQTPVTSLANHSHPVALALTPWLDTAADYLQPAFLLCHLVLPVFAVICLIGVLVSWLQEERYRAFQRFLLSTQIFLFLTVMAPSFQNYKFAYPGFIKQWLNAFMS